MNSNWRNRPTPIDYFPPNIDYIIGIDECGNSNLRHVIEAVENDRDIVDNERFFTIVACVISREEFPMACDMVMDVKNRYWRNGLYSYEGNDKRICFHSSEIRGRKNGFSPSVIDYPKFIDDLSEMMGKMPMLIYGSHIDKVSHVKQYKYPAEPYDLCLTFLFERILRDMKDNEKCVVVLESRGKKEDKVLLDWIKFLIDNGNNYHPAAYFKRIAGVYFNPKWCKDADEKKSYWELEIADLCAYPINKFFVKSEKDKSFLKIEDKIACYPQYMSKGLKSFP